MEVGLVPWQRLPVLPEAGDGSPIRGGPSQAQEGLQHGLVQAPQPVHQPGVAACRPKQAAQQAGELLCESHWLQSTAKPARFVGCFVYALRVTNARQGAVLLLRQGAYSQTEGRIQAKGACKEPCFEQGWFHDLW